MNPVVLIPTLNEEKNIYKVLKGIKENCPECAIIVIDGQSDDDTQLIVNAFSKRYRDVFLLNQKERTGYGGALKIGFTEALKANYDIVITMEGDGSHDPLYINEFLKYSDKYEVVLGSRYKNGVRVEGRRFRQLVASKLANIYVANLLVKPIWDFTSGYRLYRSDFLKLIDLKRLRNESYIVQIQLLLLIFKFKKRFKEIPFTYKDSPGRASKFSSYTRFKTFFYCLKYRAPLVTIIRHLLHFYTDYERFVKEYDDFVNPPVLKKPQKTENFKISIGVFAYNEEGLISKCLEALQKQKLSIGLIEEILVVSSGSTDNTDKIVESLSLADDKIKLIIQTQRLGKASAINEFLSRAHGDILIIESADTIAGENTVEKLVRPFRDEKIGMVGAHPLPVNDKKTFIGYSVHKLWQLHHMIASDHPKCGEMVAFRNIVPFIPVFTAVDEAVIEGLIVNGGYQLAYAPEAYVHNKGPENLRDFVKQRRRIASGHRHLADAMGHSVYTKSPTNIIKYVMKSLSFNPIEWLYLSFLITIEAYCRFGGLFDYYFRDKNPYIWSISRTTKHM